MLPTVGILDVINEIFLLVIIFAVSIVGWRIIRGLKKQITDLSLRILRKESKAHNLGSNQMKGELIELLGTFKAFVDYDQLLILSSTDQQKSLDLIGLKFYSDESGVNLLDGSIDFIEIKSKTKGKHVDRLSDKERWIKKLVDQKKVKYVIKDVELPEGLEVTDRKSTISVLDNNNEST